MTNHFEAGGFVRGNPEADYPNLMFHFLPLAIRYDGSTAISGHGYQVDVGPMLSDARGTLRIRSADPRDPPRLRFNCLSTEQGRREWVEVIDCARDLLGQPAFGEFDAGGISPGPNIRTKEEILTWVPREGETAVHPPCTCRMGTDPLSVVDPEGLRVHGIDGLRIVEASVMSGTDATLGGEALPAQSVGIHVV